MVSVPTLKGKNILLGITASIAAYKACQLASDYMKLGANVQVIMTKDSQEFIRPLTLSTLTGRPVITGLFDEVKEWKVDHVGAAQWCDCIVVAPATADIIAKFACGIANDSLTCTYLACNKPKLIAPAMNTVMYESEITQKNIETLKQRGNKFVEPATGLLACGDNGKGKLADLEDIISETIDILTTEKILSGKTVTITAGPTIEDIDPVRYLTNRSSGKMGYAIAKYARYLGAFVNLVSGPVSISAPKAVNLFKVRSAKDMYDTVSELAKTSDIVIMAAAVADYTPSETAGHKIKKEGTGIVIETNRTKDILKEIGNIRKDNQVIVGFAAETDDLEKNATKKLLSKNCDIICGNDLTKPGVGFMGETNEITMFFAGGETKKIDLTSKDECGFNILLEAAKILNSKS